MADKNKIKIHVLYFDGCPSYEPAVATIREVIDEQALDADIELVEVSSQEAAITHRFLGSPTVQINGVDVEGLATPTVKPDLSCRLYSEEGTLRGWPSREMIRTALSGTRNESGVSLEKTSCCVPQGTFE